MKKKVYLILICIFIFLIFKKMNEVIAYSVLGDVDAEHESFCKSEHGGIFEECQKFRTNCQAIDPNHPYMPRKCY